MAIRNQTQFSTDELEAILDRVALRKRQANDRDLHDIIDWIVKTEVEALTPSGLTRTAGRSVLSDDVRKLLMRRASELLPDITSKFQCKSDEEYERVVYDIVCTAACAAYLVHRMKSMESGSDRRRKYKTAIEDIEKLEESMGGFGNESLGQLRDVALILSANGGLRYDQGNPLNETTSALLRTKRLLKVCSALLGRPSEKHRRSNYPVKTGIARDCALLYYRRFEKLPAISKKSSFNDVCSFVYEIATGKQFESMSRATADAVRKLKLELRENPQLVSRPIDVEYNLAERWQSALEYGDIDPEDKKIIENILLKIGSATSRAR